jgi:hypothetical protein
MREKTITLYNYFELSDKAKDNAYRNFVSNNELHFEEEGIDALISFLKWSGISITRYEIGAYQHSYINTDIPEDCQEEIRTMRVECRLRGLDEHDTEETLLGTFEQIEIDINRMSPSYPRENIKFWGDGSWDESIIHYWDEYLKENPLDNIGAFHAVVDGTLSQMVADLEYQDSLEYFEEVEQDYENEYEEDGTIH